MKNINRVMLTVATCVISMPVLAENTDFESRWYAGAGLGVSRLKPDTNNTIYSVSDSSSNGLKLYGGYDWNDKFSIEAYIADLGESTLSPSGTVEYRDIGVSGLYYFYNNQGDNGRQNRTNLSVFAKAGLGYMKNDSDVNYDRIHDAHILLGAGLEYGFSNGFALRAEAEFFDEDSQFYSVSVLKRFGKTSKIPVAVDESVDIAVINKAVNEDSDGDGIVDSRDQCPATKEDARVDNSGCEIADIIVLQGVQFKTGSARLKGVSRSVLDGAATTLLRYPDMLVEVAGHTDSVGSKHSNQRLSLNRANAVRQYLLGKGVSAENLTARGYGDTLPVEDNNSVEGRAANRRVELRILKK